jgi:hypothetical protein
MASEKCVTVADIARPLRRGGSAAMEAPTGFGTIRLGERGSALGRAANSLDRPRFAVRCRRFPHDERQRNQASDEDGESRNNIFVGERGRLPFAQ